MRDLAAFSTCHGITTESPKCHPEHSEGSRCPGREILRYAQDDTAYRNINLDLYALMPVISDTNVTNDINVTIL